MKAMAGIGGIGIYGASAKLRLRELASLFVAVD